MQLSSLLSACGLSVPARLPAFMALLAGMEDCELLDPGERAGMHPLLIPVGRLDSGVVIGLLRWPTPEPNMPIPVVRAGSAGLSLWAGSIDQLLHAELATRDTHGLDMAGLLAAANRGERLYSAGGVAESGLPLKAYLLLRVGGLPELYEELSLKHLAKGDAVAASVTAERAGVASPGWGRPQAFLSQLMAQQGRTESARLAAQAALTLPLWTLGAPFEQIAASAGWEAPFLANPYRRLAEDERKPPLDRAAHWMDVWSIEGSPWDLLRPGLVALYEEAGLHELAEFVGGG